jgi:hypothetical protein
MRDSNNPKKGSFQATRKGSKHWFNIRMPYEIMFSRRSYNHPSVIVGENRKEYAYLPMSHNVPVKQNGYKKMHGNPDPNDSKDAYIRMKMKTDDKRFHHYRNFWYPKGKRWRLDSEDEQMVDSYLKKKVR